MKDINIIVVGVGGQGIILVSDAIAQIGMDKGFDVKKSDSLGMAQRGGSVVSHVRWAEHVFSPMVCRGDADFLLAGEQLEAARWAPHLKKGGVAMVADVVAVPPSAVGSSAPYPDRQEVDRILRQYTDKVFQIPVTRICREIGNPKALNMVLLGFLSTFLDVEPEAWTRNIRAKLPAKFVESSIAAFEKGGEEARLMRENLVKGG